MDILEISEKDFNNIDCVRRIISHDNSRRFASIEIDKIHGKYGLSWRSDLISPVIINSSESSLIWLGVDQQLVGVSKLEGNVVVALQLDSNLIDITSSESTIAVLTESALFLFNSDGSINLIKDLPEIGSGVSFIDNVLCVDMIDGETLSVELNVFKLASIY
jgi:hypothetical protein